jgi:hypothetical protein
MSGTILDVGDDRLILDVPEKNYHLNLTFPHLVDYESGGAQYNRKTKVCTCMHPNFDLSNFEITLLLNKLNWYVKETSDSRG